jgi:glycerol-3-phosphate dehydrogenase (NAD(P)+)
VSNVAIIGAGSWGTAFAWLLGTKGVPVQLRARSHEVVDGISELRRNPRYLPEVVLPETVRATVDLEEAVADADVVVFATPSQAVRETATSAAEFARPDVVALSLAKGLEAGTHLRMTQVLGEVFDGIQQTAALSGPNHAEEVSRGIPSATVVAAYDADVGARLQELANTPTFRVYTNEDVIGVEMGGASKNVIAIACGASDGLGYGDNAKAGLMTRGLAEMTRLGTAVGANPLTYMGLAGMGDLIATCTSRHSRNRALGELIAKGGTLDDFHRETHMVAEGAMNVVALDELGTTHGCDMPITKAVRAALYEGYSPSDAVAELMGRRATDELHDLGLVEGDVS